jgi:hypothetical protein
MNELIIKHIILCFIRFLIDKLIGRQNDKQLQLPGGI